jgi:phage FluMu protein Com
MDNNVVLVTLVEFRCPTCEAWRMVGIGEGEIRCMRCNSLIAQFMPVDPKQLVIPL